MEKLRNRFTFRSGAVCLVDAPPRARSYSAEAGAVLISSMHATSKPAKTSPGRLVYHNGLMIPESEARLSIYDSALMFGDVAFEMTRSFNKRQFRLREHLERLVASTRWLNIPFDYTVDQLEAICQQVVEANDAVFAADDEH